MNIRDEWGERAHPWWMIPPPTLTLSLSHTDILTGAHQGQIQLCILPMGTDSSVNIDNSLSAAQNTVPSFLYHASTMLYSEVL